MTERTEIILSITDEDLMDCGIDPTTVNETLFALIAKDLSNAISVDFVNEQIKLSYEVRTQK